jgi:hypothetical protein
MALRKYLGQAIARANVWTFTVNTTTGGTVVGVASPTGNSVQHTAGSGETATTLATALAAKLAATTVGEFAEMTWTSAGAVITATAKVAGVPNTFTAAGTSSAVTATEATTATGPNDGANALNWLGGAVPADDDAVVLDASSPSLLYGLAVLDGLDLASFTTDGFSGAIGLPVVRGEAGLNTLSSGRYLEYRRRDLRLAGGFPIVIGRNAAPTRAVVTVGTVTSVIQVLSGNVYLKTTGTGHSLYVSGGTVNVATETGDAATFATAVVAAQGDSQQVVTRFGAGVTLTLLTNRGGLTECAAATELMMNSDRATHTQTAGNLDATITAGQLRFATAAELTVTASGAATIVDFTGDPRPKTFGSGSKFSGGAKLIDPGKTRGTSSCTFDALSLPGSKLGDGVVCS